MTPNITPGELTMLPPLGGDTRVRPSGTVRAGADRRVGPVAARGRRIFSTLTLTEVVREALYGLYHHRFRAALSMLGISWGIISVVMLLAYGNGFRGALEA